MPASGRASQMRRAFEGGEQGQEGAHREIEAVGQVDHAEDAEHQGEAEREQGIGRAGDDAIDELLGQHRGGLQAASVAWLSRAPAPCRPRRIVLEDLEGAVLDLQDEDAGRVGRVAVLGEREHAQHAVDIWLQRALADLVALQRAGAVDGFGDDIDRVVGLGRELVGVGAVFGVEGGDELVVGGSTSCS